MEASASDTIKSSFETTERRRWAERVVKAADRYFREKEHGWLGYKELTFGCAELIKRWELDFVEAGYPLIATAAALAGDDDKKKAEDYLRRAVLILEKHLGANHLDVAMALYELGQQQLHNESSATVRTM